MLLGTERKQMRDVFFRAWRNFREKRPLEGIEGIVVEIALRHPEYQDILENPQAHEHEDYDPETGQSNPFLHMALHIAIHEQLSTNRPAGILHVHQALLARLADSHVVEHRMMDCLAESLWRAQREGKEAAERDYLACLKRQTGHNQ